MTTAPIFLASPAFQRVITADSLAAIAEIHGSTRAYFTDGKELSAWKRAPAEIAAELNKHLPRPMVTISTGGTVRRKAYVNLLALTGWSSNQAGLLLHTHNATVLLSGFDMLAMNEAVAASGQMIVQLGVV